MDYDQILQYINDFNISGARDPQYFCFSAVYTLVLLQDGYGFWPNSTVTVVDTVRGNKVGWPLGAILHEINNLPWELEDPFKRVPWGSYVRILCLTFVLPSLLYCFDVSFLSHIHLLLPACIL